MATLKRLSAVLALLGLTACAQMGPQPVDTEAKAREAARQAEEKAAADKAAQLARLPKQELTPQILFQFLVAEVAGQRGQLEVAKQTYLDLARETQDPRVAGRATEIAAYARDAAGTLAASEIWLSSDPESERARRSVVALRLARGEFGFAEPVLRDMIAADPAKTFMELPAMLARSRDPKASYELVSRLAAESPKLPEAHFALAQVAQLTGHADEAMKELQEATRLRPDWEPVAVVQAQLMARDSRDDALAFLKRFVERNPDANDARLAYARMLVGANRVDEARSEFLRLSKAMPQNPEVALSAALLALQAGDAATAEPLLRAALSARPKEPETIYYYLGVTQQQLKQTESALEWYRKVESGNYLVQARSREANILADQGKIAEARKLLTDTEARSDEDKIRLVQAEGEVLRAAKDHQAVYDLLSGALAKWPDSTDLLYERAMAAEKIDKLDVLETDLRRLIKLKPEDAQAYNALGYTLADRTDRLKEAESLLDQALKLSPDDPFILDSAGWAQYRLGNLDQAQRYIERAYHARPDPEIAAHLGEVMWARGYQKEAAKLWQAALDEAPKNELLLETIKRFPH